MYVASAAIHALLRFLYSSGAALCEKRVAVHVRERQRMKMSGPALPVDINGAPRAIDHKFPNGVCNSTITTLEK